MGLSRKTNISREVGRSYIAFYHLVLEHGVTSAILSNCQRSHRPTETQREGAWPPYLNGKSIKEFAAMFFTTIITSFNSSLHLLVGYLGRCCQNGSHTTFRQSQETIVDSRNNVISKLQLLYDT